MNICECQDKAVSNTEIINYFTASLLTNLNKLTYNGVSICFFLSPKAVFFKGWMAPLHYNQVRRLLKM